MKTLTLLAAFFLFTGFTAMADEPGGNTEESLRGMTGVYVSAQIVNVQPAGLTTNDIINLVKSALADAGVTVDASTNKLNGNATLSVTVATAVQSQLNAYVFNVEVAVTQDVLLVRRPHADGMVAVTWRRTTQGITTPTRTDVIQQAVKQGLSTFVKDYRAVNGK